MFLKAGDSASTGKILVCIIDMCYEAKNFKALKENLLLLNKRRAQSKAAIKAMVKHCMGLLDSLPYDQKMDLLNTLISVTEGKVRRSAGVMVAVLGFERRFFLVSAPLSPFFSVCSCEQN